jgi:hypothetical protein
MNKTKRYCSFVLGAFFYPRSEILELLHEDRQTGQTGQTGSQGRQTDRQTDKQGKQTDRQTGRADRQTDRQGRQTDRQTDRCVESNEWIFAIHVANIPEPKAGQKMRYKINIV